jgi:hypothetical protein
MRPQDHEIELEPEQPEDQVWCSTCEHWSDDCVCEELTDWFKTVSFEQLFELSAQGNKEATEELLSRQCEYNRNDD